MMRTSMNLAAAGSGPRLLYPPAAQDAIVDTHHGVRVPDPYRWLEDPDTPETRGWVEAQNALTRGMLDTPARASIAARLRVLYDYPRTSLPVIRGRRTFFTFNPGLDNQPVLYVEDVAGGHPRVLLNPNSSSDDGTIALTAYFPDDDGIRVALALSRSGSDRQEIRVRDVATGENLPDRLLWVKFASVAWTPSGEGFYYTRFPQPGSVAAGDEHYFPKVCYHRCGTEQAEDAVLFERPADREVVFGLETTDDGRWLIITAYKGASDRSEIYLLDRGSSAIQPLFTGFEHAWTFIGDAEGRLFFMTDERAPRGRIVAVAAGAAAGPVEIVPEERGSLTGAVLAGSLIAACHLTDASHGVKLFDYGGGPAGQVDLPPHVSVTGLDGARRRSTLALSYSSFTEPPAALVHDTEQRVTTPFDRGPALAPAAQAPRSRAECVTRQVWFASKDGTRVSMFLVHRRDLDADGWRPVLLTGYGGFNVNMTPLYDPANRVLIDAGGVLAVPQLRGGGEYGEDWHRGGMLERKQNVFDDLIAAAEWLIESGLTRPERLAIEGGSNGGLLTAAVMLQRPDLFGAVICRVPVADMLRYHLFTVGRFWIPEYGCADEPAQFAWLIRYSPYHNVERGRPYPPVLITTADTDDRVAPGMAKKFAARLQASADGGPFLIRVETRAGHGAGKPVAKMIEEDADIFTFIGLHLNVLDDLA
jgi:prolyl oligopeptidase